MTPPRNIGPLLAVAGGVLGLLAAIVGLLITGGPGQARDRRIDDMTLQRIGSLSSGVECAFRLAGEMPASPSDVMIAVAAHRHAAEESGCGAYVYDAQNLERSWQDLEYQVVADRRFRICASFRLAGTPVDKAAKGMEWGYAAPELSKPRPESGRHCYEIAVSVPSAE